MAIDGNGDIVVAGQTRSSDFPAVNAHQAQQRGEEDAFVAKVLADGSAIVFSTYLGGADEMPFGHQLSCEAGIAIAADGSGNVVTCGKTCCSDFPTLRALQPAHGPRSPGYEADVFVAKLSGTGVLEYSTFLGGSGNESCNAILADARGDAVSVGVTDSADFPGAGAPAGGKDMYAASVAADGSSLVFSTLVGGSGLDAGEGVSRTGDGDLLIAASTSSADFPVSADALQPAFGGVEDGVLVLLEADGATARWATYFGGADGDAIVAAGMVPDGRIWFAGDTWSTDLPLLCPQQNRLGGSADGFVASCSGDGSILYSSTYLGGSRHEQILSLRVDSSGSATFSGRTASTDFPVLAPYQALAGGGTYDAFLGKIRALPPPGVVGNSVMAVKRASGAEAEFFWADVATATAYYIRSDASKGGVFSSVWGTGISGVSGVRRVVPTNPLALFRVTAASCEGEGPLE